MTQSDLSAAGVVRETKSGRKDWVLLPVVSLMTICVLAISAEVISRWFYPSHRTGFENCFHLDDLSGNGPVRPNSVCWERTAESTTDAEYRFNSKGHRAGAELTPKPPGTYRIVLIGSSVTQGLFVPREKTFAALLPEELSVKTGRRVEVYNEATGGKFRGGPYPTESSVEHFGQVLAAQPDMILWVITPADIVNAGAVESPDAGSSSGGLQAATDSAKPQTLWAKMTAWIANEKFGGRLNFRWEQTRTSIVLKHLLIASESQEEYIQSYLSNADNANFLKTEPDPKWREQEHTFFTELNGITGAAKSAGIPLTAVFVPNRPQAAMLARGDWPTGYNPLKLECEVRGRIVSQGDRFIDILGDYRNLPAPEREYFPVDGHPDPAGHATIARFLARELSSGVVPELKVPNTAEAVAPEPCG